METSYYYRTLIKDKNATPGYKLQEVGYTTFFSIINIIDQFVLGA